MDDFILRRVAQMPNLGCTMVQPIPRTRIRVEVSTVKFAGGYWTRVSCPELDLRTHYEGTLYTHEAALRFARDFNIDERSERDSV